MQQPRGQPQPPRRAQPTASQTHQQRREDAQELVVFEHPRNLAADPAACHSVARKACQLAVGRRLLRAAVFAVRSRSFLCWGGRARGGGARTLLLATPRSLRPTARTHVREKVGWERGSGNTTHTPRERARSPPPPPQPHPHLLLVLAQAQQNLLRDLHSPGSACFRHDDDLLVLPALLGGGGGSRSRFWLPRRVVVVLVLAWRCCCLLAASCNV